MSLYNVRDKSFNERQFTSVLDYLDAYVLAQMLADLDMKYDIVSGGQNHMGNIHQVIVYSRFLQKGFKLDLYENQTLSVKGVFHVQVYRKEIDIVEIKKKLNELQLKFDLKVRGGEASFAVKLTNLLQYVDMIELFKSQLP